MNTMQTEQGRLLALEYQQHLFLTKLMEAQLQSLTRNNPFKVAFVKKEFCRWFMELNQDNWNEDPIFPDLPLNGEQHEANIHLANYFCNEKLLAENEKQPFLQRLWGSVESMRQSKQCKPPIIPSIQWTDNGIQIGDGEDMRHLAIQKLREVFTHLDDVHFARLMLKYIHPFILQNGKCLSEIRQVTDLLYEKFDVRFEACASALDSMFLHQNKTDTKYCSLFHSVEKQFGSLGNFFQLDLTKEEHQGSWLVSTMFLESFINDIAAKILFALRFHQVKSCFYILLPMWLDLQGIVSLRQSHFCLAILDDLQNVFFDHSIQRKCSAKNKPICYVIVGHPSFRRDDFHLIANIKRN